LSLFLNVSRVEARLMSVGRASILDGKINLKKL